MTHKVKFKDKYGEMELEFHFEQYRDLPQSIKDLINKQNKQTNLDKFIKERVVRQKRRG